MEKELNKIAQIIYRKIYNENIRIYTQLAQEGKEYYNFVLEESCITPSMIEQAILHNEDLNQLNNLSIQNYITTDLNAFYTKIIAVRDINMDYFSYMILEGDINSFIFALRDILECFTENESIQIQKAFLKRTLNCYDIDAMDNETINRLFLPLFREMINQKQEVALKLI